MEGEYKNGRRNGKFKEYDSDGKFVREIKFKKGKIWDEKRKDYICPDKFYEGEKSNGEKKNLI